MTHIIYTSKSTYIDISHCSNAKLRVSNEAFSWRLPYVIYESPRDIKFINLRSNYT